MSSVILTYTRRATMAIAITVTVLALLCGSAHSLPRPVGSDSTTEIESTTITATTTTTTSEDVGEEQQQRHLQKRNVEVDNQASDEEALPLAIEYLQSVIRDYSCHAPQPRVLSVQGMHPRADATYATGSVVLHRCAHDSGCCQLSEVCTAKTKTTIQLPILMLNHAKLVEFMSFVNHTECHCVSRKEYVAD